MAHRNRRDKAPAYTPALEAPHLAPHFMMLGPEQCQRLHAASCQILERTGVRFYQPGACNLLKAAGAKVEADLVKIPAALVEQAIASAPRRILHHHSVHT